MQPRAARRAFSAALPLLAALALGPRASAQSAEGTPTAAPPVDTLRETPALRALRQRWATPFAVEGSGQTAAREPRAPVTWLAPDTTRRRQAPLADGPPPAPAPAATPPRRPTPAAPARPSTHTVARRETFLGIARKYGLTQDALRAANPGVAWERVRVGLVLRIPAAPAAARTPASPAARPSAAATPARRAAAPAPRDTAADDSADSSAAADSAPAAPRPARRDSSRTARPAAPKDSAARRPAARRDSASAARAGARADSAAKRPAARRDSAAARTPVRRDTAAINRARRDSVARAATARRDSAAARSRSARTDSASARHPAPQRSATRRHTVTAGESLFAIARQYGVAAQRIRDVNGLTDDKLRIGQTLVIPPSQ